MEIKCDCESHKMYQNRGYINNELIFIETRFKSCENNFYYCYCKGCLSAEPLDDSWEKLISEKEYIVCKLLE